MSEQEQLVSVIVPVLSWTEDLERCLKALSEQTYKNFELILVNNGTDKKIEESAERYSFARYFEETFPSSYAARNKGVLEAKGQILAFTDSDCIPASDWLAQGIHALFEDPEISLIGGQILMFSKEERASLIEEFEMLIGFKQKTYVEQWLFAATANLFTYKKVFEALGLFEKNLKSAGDLDWGRRVYSEGLKQRYLHEAIVRHPAQTSLRALLLRLCRVRGGLSDYRKMQGESFFKRLFFSFSDWPKYRDFSALLLKRELSFARSTQLSSIFLVYKISAYLEDMRLLFGAKSRRN